MEKVKLLSLYFVILVFTGCSSHDVTIAPTQPENYTILGKAKGTANGSIGVGPTTLNFIPIGLNTRIERAYDNAIKSVPGATGLINVTYQEDWFWWVIGSNKKVTITGDAIKEIK